MATSKTPACMPLGQGEVVDTQKGSGFLVA